VASLAACVDIRERSHHAGVRGNLISGLVVPGVAQVAKITEGVLGVPGGAVIVDRILGLRFVAVLAGGGLRPALGFYRCGGHQEDTANYQQQAKGQEEEGDSFLTHVHLVQTDG
jgi:hypothetical protein